MREKITYIADDGTEFVDELDCQKYERAKEFQEWYSTHPILFTSNPNSIVPIQHVVDWLKFNRDDILLILRSR